MHELPPELAASPFAVHRALETGISPARLRNPALETSVWGVRATRHALNLADRCALFATRLSGDPVFSHTTAAVLLRMPLESGHVERDLHVTYAAGRRAAHAAGIRGHQMRLEASEIVEWRGLRITSPVRTWRDLGGLLRLHDLVAAGDRLIAEPYPATTAAALALLVNASPRRRGARRLAEAIPLLDGASESPQESVLRVILQLAGFPRPRINHTIVSTDAGKDVRPDFRFDDERIVLEYQGEYHRSRHQWRADMTRRSRLEAAGWVVVELNADDLKDPVELVARLQTIFARQARGR